MASTTAENTAGELNWKIKVDITPSDDEAYKSKHMNEMGENREMKLTIECQAFIERLFLHKSIKSGTIKEDLDRSSLNFPSILERLLADDSEERSQSISPDCSNEITILSNTVAGYLQLLPRQERIFLSEKVKNETTKWLIKLFRLESFPCLYHQQSIEGLVKVCKLALHSKYTKYASDGFTALYTRPPVVYISAAAPQSLAAQLQHELGLPQSSICIVPCNNPQTSPFVLNVSAFERHLTDDISCGKTPLLLIAYAGTPLTGHTDNLERLREVCTQSGVWLHVQGDSLVNLVLGTVPPSIQCSSAVDSVTLSLPQWFSVFSLPSCTFYRTNTECVETLENNLSAFPLWVLFQYMGAEGLEERVTHAAGLTQQMCDRLDVITGVKRIEQPSSASTCVVFKYRGSPVLPLSVNPEKTKVPARGTVEVSKALVNDCNSYLFEYLSSTVKQVAIEKIVVPKEGVCLRFQPIRSCKNHDTNASHVDDFAEQLQTKIIEFDACFVHRTVFLEVFASLPDVQIVDVHDKPALGAFQCMPKYWKTKKMENLSDMKKHESNELNSKIFTIVQNHFDRLELKSLENGLNCIEIGIVDESFDVKLLGEMVVNCSIQLEDNEKYVAEVKEAVQKSIEEAKVKLDREREEKFFEDGVLRNVPLVSSLYNWWSPPPEHSHGVVGRSFDLESGKLETTQKLYEFKMQVNESVVDETVEEKTLENEG